MLGATDSDIGRPIPGFVQSLAHIVAIRIRRDLLEQGMKGVRPVHAPLLAALLGGARRAADLAASAGVSRQAIAQVVANLERDGHVERIADPGDNRAKLVCLTAKGRAALRSIRRSNRALEDEWRERIGAERLSVLRDIVTDLLESADGRDG